MYSHTNTTQSFLVEHFKNESWDKISSHEDRSAAETALARWVDDDVSRSSSGARIVHQIVTIKNETIIVKELEF